ncbi:hypothetical protein JCM1841_003000 [Sporobolomyces salmonicolor]
MSSTPSGNLVSPTAHLHLAPPYALAPASSTGNNAPTPSSASASKLASAPPASHPTLRPFTSDELRQLVLEYLCSSCYAETAKAFAQELDEARTGGEAKGDRDEDAAEASTGRVEATVGHGAAETEAMDGVEATPPPEDWRNSAAEDEMQDVKADRPPAGHTNGKNVAFLDDGLGEAEEDEDDDDYALLSKEELRDVRLRRSIRDAILAGRISHAVDLLNEHFPSALSPSPSSSSAPPSPSKLSPLHPEPHKSTSCTPQTFFVATPIPSSSIPSGVSGSDSPSPSPVPVVGATFGPWALSLSPEILALNLQLQSFVELMRAGHASSAVSTPSTPTSSLNGHATRDVDSDAGMSASTSSFGASSILNVAIAQSQALRAKVLELPPGRDREAWERECVDVCGLLAYKDLVGCPVRGYLAQSRRETLAEMVNAAVLQRSHRSPLPLLSLVARQTTAIWHTLGELKVQFPPAPTSTSDSKNKPSKTYPTFDLHSFLNERDPASPAAVPMVD